MVRGMSHARDKEALLLRLRKMVTFHGARICGRFASKGIAYSAQQESLLGSL
jgi:hypothetical protein